MVEYTKPKFDIPIKYYIKIFLEGSWFVGNVKKGRSYPDFGVAKDLRKNLKNKILCISSAVCFLSNQLLAVGYAKNIDFLTPSNIEDITVLKQYVVANDIKNPLVTNILAKNIPLNKYEIAIITEKLRQEMMEKINNRDKTRADLINVVEIQNKYPDVYKSIFDKNPLNVVGGETEQPSGTAISEQELAKIPDQLSDEDNTKVWENLQQYVLEGKQWSSSPDENLSATEPTDKFQQDIINAQTPQEQADAVSLTKINLADPSKKEDWDESKNKTPVSDFVAVANHTQAPSENIVLGTKEQDSLISAINAEFLNSTVKKAKNYYVFLNHNLTYIKEKGDGNVPYDTTYTDDEGNYYVPKVTDQYQFEETLDVGIGFTLFKAVDMVVGFVAKNENGGLWQSGSTWKFDVLSMKFRPIDLTNKAGVDIKDGGKQVGKQVGSTYVGGNTDSGNVGVAIASNNGTLQYDYQSNSLQAQGKDAKYYLALGNLSLSLSSYTLKLSDCRAVQVGYKDNDVELMGLYAKSQSRQEGYTENETTYPGKYDRYIWATQYVAKNLFAHIDTTLNYAVATDKGSLQNPAGAKKTKTSVYSLVVKSKNLKNTSFQGEFAKSYNSVDSQTVSGNADYLDISHRFTGRLSGTLHLINIDKSYNADTLVEDTTGEYLLTTNTGDGYADYLYKAGQKGFDLTMNYRFPENASIAFGWSKYSLTTDGNSKNNYYLSGEKSWSINDENGTSIADIGVQQRFEYNNVSSNNYSRKVSDTTISVDATPWQNAELDSNYQIIRDNYEGDENRFDLSFAQNFYPIERVRITPQVKYSRKSGTVGLDGQEAVDTTTLINSLTVGYELIPEELVVNVMVSKEKYDVISSEIDKTTGAKVDGENRSVLGAGIGLVWKPKKIAGLTASVSYRKDRVDYVTPAPDHSNQDVWDLSLKYDMPISNNIRASISYDYKTARDKVKPIYDETTRTVAINIDASLGNHSTLKLSHAFESEYKPLDPANNYKTQTTSIYLNNKF